MYFIYGSLIIFSHPFEIIILYRNHWAFYVNLFFDVDGWKNYLWWELWGFVVRGLQGISFFTNLKQKPNAFSSYHISIQKHVPKLTTPGKKNSRIDLSFELKEETLFIGSRRKNTWKSHKDKDTFFNLKSDILHTLSLSVSPEMGFLLIIRICVW